MKCDVCNKMIYGTYVEHVGGFIHSDCFVCDICGLSIEGSFIKHQEKYYHESCYKTTFGIICIICKRYINGRCFCDPYGNYAHSEHFENIEAFHCQSCSSIYAYYSNNTAKKKLCPDCYNDSQHSNEDIKKSLKYISYVLKKRGISPISVEPKDVMVCSPEKIKNLSGGKNTKGLAIVKQSTFTTKLNHCIYIVEHLPKIEFQAVLAHEIGHTWIAEQSIELLKQQEEGFCNLCAFLIYDDWNSIHGDILIEKLEKDTTPVYGDGFREMKKLLMEKGWKDFIHVLH